MIFLTLGTQLPFDRLVKAVDNWCAVNPDKEVFGQIAVTEGVSYIPSNFHWTTFVEPDEYTRIFNGAHLIVAHAGMGSIISALTGVKPIIIMPRKASLFEHRNDHQLATAQKVESREGIYVATNEKDLEFFLDQLTAVNYAASNSGVGKFADSSLIDKIRIFIDES